MGVQEAAKQRNDQNAYVFGVYNGVGALHPSEVLWRDRYVYLKEHGYALRTRYNPQWKPSWIGKDIPPDSCEDCIMSLEDKVLDAMLSEKQYRVSIKEVSRSSDEIKIARMLSSMETARNPNNHCVPVLDVLPDPLDSSKALLIMPYLRPFDDPEFEVVEEVMDFIRQTLEGLSFIHSQGVAHRDCSSGNVMMDGRPLFPEDHHPVHIQLRPDLSHDARCLSRLKQPVRYYYIDFGMSSSFMDGESPYVLGAKGGDQDVPELSNDVPYNAFMLDVFILGHLYEGEFLKQYVGLNFLEPLIFAMMDKQPERRPSAEAALRMFHGIRRGLNTTQLYWRLRKRDESGAERVIYDIISAAKVSFGLVRRGLMG